MKNGNSKIKKTRKTAQPKYSIKDYQNGNETLDEADRERIEATVAVLHAIDRQEKRLKNVKN